MLEPEWNDHYRGLVEGLALHDRECCPDCGLHPWVLAHPELFHLTLEDSYCNMCKLQARHGRRTRDREEAWERENKDAPPGKPRPNDGLHTRVKPLTEAEVAARQARKAGPYG